MEMPKETGESTGKGIGEKNERRMKISRKVPQTMRYRKEDYNIDILEGGECGRMIKDLIRTRGMQHWKAQEEEVWELAKWGKRNFECQEKDQGDT